MRRFVLFDHFIVPKSTIAPLSRTLRVVAKSTRDETKNSGKADGRPDHFYVTGLSTFDRPTPGPCRRGDRGIERRTRSSPPPALRAVRDSVVGWGGRTAVTVGVPPARADGWQHHQHTNARAAAAVS